MSSAIRRLGTVLSIWAHPDDETFLAGGVMAAARDHGQTVVCVSATDGEHGTDDPVSWPPQRLGRLRRQEATEAMGTLGVEDHRWLGFEDGGLAALDDEVGVEAVRTVIDDVSPDTVLTFGADGMTFHPDHIAVGRWVTQACSELATGSRPRVLTAALERHHHRRFRDRLERWAIYMTEDRPIPVDRAALALHLELTPEDLDRKMAALHAMRSQIEPALTLMTPAELRSLYAQESFVESDLTGKARR